MKKVYLFLLAFVCTVGAWAEGAATVDAVKNGYIYTIASTRNAITWDGTDTKCVGATLNASSVNHQFVAIKSSLGDDLFYFYNVGAQKFMSKESNNASLVDSYPFYWKVKASGNETWPLMIDAQDGNHFNFGGNGQITIDSWGTADDGNRLQIVEISAADESLVTDITAKAQKADVVNGSQNTVNNTSATRVGAVSSAAVADISSALTAFNADKSDANFATLKTAYEAFDVNTAERVTLSAGDKFKIFSTSNRGHLVYTTLTINDETAENTPTLAGTNSNQSSFPSSIDLEGVYSDWAFIENDGNRYLYNVEKKAFINPVSGGTFEFTTAKPAIYQKEDKGDCKWAVKFGNQYMELSPGFGLLGAVRQIGHSNDAGSWFYLEKVGESVDATVQDEMNTIIEDSKVLMWKESVLPVLGYVGGYGKSLESAINAITTKAEMDAFVNANNPIEVKDGGYYFVVTSKNQNAGQGRYMSYSGTDCYVYELAAGVKPGVEHVWQFNAPADGGFKFMSCNLGNYLQTVAAGDVSTIVADMDYGYKYELTINDFAEITIKDGDQKVLRTENLTDGKGKVNQWTNGSTNMNTNATWYIIPAEEIDVTVGEAGYATTYLPFDVTVPTTVEAYAVTGSAPTYATLEKKTGIPAKHGAILKGEGTHTLTIATADAWESSLLEGTCVDTKVKEDAYVLSNKNGIGLYLAEKNQQVDAANDSWLNNANKAYLPAPVAGAPMLTFDFGTETAIENVTVEKGNAAIYDLSGRRVKAAQKGIFIINGKKVIK